MVMQKLKTPHVQIHELTCLFCLYSLLLRNTSKLALWFYVEIEY